MIPPDLPNADPDADPTPDPNPDSFASIRDMLAPLIGATLVDITQHDAEDWDEGCSFLTLQFDNGVALQFNFPKEGAEDLTIYDVLDVLPIGREDDDAGENPSSE